VPSAPVTVTRVLAARRNGFDGDSGEHTAAAVGHFADDRSGLLRNGRQAWKGEQQDQEKADDTCTEHSGFLLKAANARDRITRSVGVTAAPRRPDSALRMTATESSRRTPTAVP
jgi:hypothetical protein